jgi:hypothetical protein
MLVVVVVVVAVAVVVVAVVVIVTVIVAVVVLVAVMYSRVAQFRCQRSNRRRRHSIGSFFSADKNCA